MFDHGMPNDTNTGNVLISRNTARLLPDWLARTNEVTNPCARDAHIPGPGRTQRCDSILDRAQAGLISSQKLALRADLLAEMHELPHAEMEISK